MLTEINFFFFFLILVAKEAFLIFISFYLMY